MREISRATYLKEHNNLEKVLAAIEQLEKNPMVQILKVLKPKVRYCNIKVSSGVIIKCQKLSEKGE